MKNKIFRLALELFVSLRVTRLRYRSGHLTQYMRFVGCTSSPPPQASRHIPLQPSFSFDKLGATDGQAFKMVKYGCSGTSRRAGQVAYTETLDASFEGSPVERLLNNSKLIIYYENAN